ncbi:uncharacterized protein BCR38DRAFT_448178 [Pseudomassariella vexata]|uniref:Extracellular membrane protein CFEM domain-containing protein n=1 Tax=Pseudomassariella vexata TaxID=1141098 RepID=A0A1Y2DG93_9PEZI|nr:uncharacterized protein BCR38DRAFT_448178 [Pseudomassariella vexata]ORY58136.1 hypothetical protein BCR38DRAFT_448178 [Pseudomassariella vexata]
MASATTHALFRLALLQIILSILTTAKTTNGPEAPVTIITEAALKTGRACATNCVENHGNYPCGLAGYYALGQELGCGCNSANGCFCNAGYGSSATSYLSECISDGCAKSVDNWTLDLSSMLGVYDAYCATANVGTATTTGGIAGKTTTAGASRTGQADATSTSDPQAEGRDGGLSKSDIVALAASLGVGIPSLLIAAITLWVQMRKRRRASDAQAQAQAQTQSPNQSQDAMATTQVYQTVPQGYDVVSATHSELSGKATPSELWGSQRY